MYLIIGIIHPNQHHIYIIFYVFAKVHLGVWILFPNYGEFISFR